MGATSNVDAVLHRIDAASSHQELRDPMQALALLAAEGEQQAIDGLLATIDRRNLALPAIKRLLFNPEDQADVAQDVLVAVANSIGSFRGEANVLSWLHSLSSNCAMAFLRRKRDHEDITPVEASWGARFTSIASDQLTVQRAIADLPDHYRSAVTLRDIHQLSYADVAKQLGLNLNTARAHIARGRALVAAELGGSFAGFGAIGMPGAMPPETGASA